LDIFIEYRSRRHSFRLLQILNALSPSRTRTVPDCISCLCVSTSHRNLLTQLLRLSPDSLVSPQLSTSTENLLDCRSNLTLPALRLDKTAQSSSEASAAEGTRLQRVRRRITSWKLASTAPEPSNQSVTGTMLRGSRGRRGGDICAIFVHAGAGYHSIQNEHIHLEACNEYVSPSASISSLRVYLVI